MHYLEKITKIEFQRFKVKEDTKALSKIAKEVSRIQSMVTSYRALTERLFSYKARHAPTKLVVVWFVSKIIVILAKKGMTYKCVIFSF